MQAIHRHHHRVLRFYVVHLYSVGYISLQVNTLLCYTLVLVIVLGIGIARGQYYWILGALLGIVLILMIGCASYRLIKRCEDVPLAFSNHFEEQQ